jgi:hypothetical protein
VPQKPWVPNELNTHTLAFLFMFSRFEGTKHARARGFLDLGNNLQLKSGLLFCKGCEAAK